MSVSLTKTRILKEGEITADGSEQTILEIHELATVYGWIDLSEMVANDVVTIKYYVRTEEYGEFRKYAEETYRDVQDNPMVRFPPVVSRYGIKITLQQTSGEFKSFKYQFFKGVV